MRPISQCFYFDDISDGREPESASFSKEKWAAMHSQEIAGFALSRGGGIVTCHRVKERSGCGVPGQIVFIFTPNGPMAMGERRAATSFGLVEGRSHEQLLD